MIDTDAVPLAGSAAARGPRAERAPPRAEARLRPCPARPEAAAARGDDGENGRVMPGQAADPAGVHAAVAALEGNATLTHATRRAIAGTLAAMLAEQRRLEALLAVPPPLRKETTVDWTDAMIARLRALWADGHSTAEIGRRMGISKNAVVGKTHRLQLAGRQSPVKRGGQPPAPRRVAKGVPAVVDAREGGASLAPAAAIATAPPLATTTAPAPAPVPRVGRGTPCCWPIGTPGRPEFHFCDQASLPGKPYCQPHADLAYVKVRDRRDAA